MSLLCVSSFTAPPCLLRSGGQFIPGLRRANLPVYLSELPEQNIPLLDLGVTVYAEDDLLKTTGMEIVIHHEVENLPVTFPDLIHELREGYAPRNEPLAGLRIIEVSQPPARMPDDQTWDYVFRPDNLIRQNVPFPDPNASEPPKIEPSRVESPNGPSTSLSLHP
jgi:hypothetical protein